MAAWLWHKQHGHSVRNCKHSGFWILRTTHFHPMCPCFVNGSNESGWDHMADGSASPLPHNADHSQLNKPLFSIKCGRLLSCQSPSVLQCILFFREFVFIINKLSVSPRVILNFYYGYFIKFVGPNKDFTLITDSSIYSGFITTN
jgi:hypothetical protein